MRGVSRGFLDRSWDAGGGHQSGCFVSGVLSCETALVGLAVIEAIVEVPVGATMLVMLVELGVEPPATAPAS